MKQQIRKAETLKALQTAASRAFRSQGYSGTGVDGIAKQAGATSGAFYAHLGSKDRAFQTALELGLNEVIEAIPDYQARHGKNWPEAFARYYLGAAHRKDRACGCAMTALSPDVVRASAETRSLFEEKMKTITGLIADGLETGDDEDRAAKAWAFLSILIGALTTARALASEAQAEKVAAAALHAALTIVAR
ncbi:TetR/AcrR family transcriptional regulator [Roseibium sp.]|uniref:TetR/AcrR family transcriptional regulator n=1 Tax=Roseibium sp. TaxID=1936156 RepID=UPI003D0DA2F1